MRAVLTKVINWKGKEYAYIIEDQFDQFCDSCVFSELCSDAIVGKVPLSETPMKICQKLSDELNTTTAFFMEASKANEYIQRVNRND